MSKQAQIKPEEVPSGWSTEAADFINKLLLRKPMNRLGIKGIDELINHDWFKDFNFNDLKSQKMISPFIPPQTDNIDFDYLKAKDKISLETLERYKEIMEEPHYLTAFKDFLFIKTEEYEQFKKQIKTKKEVIIREEKYNNLGYFKKDSTNNEKTLVKSSSLVDNTKT
jgi:hypothetical protein